LFNPDFAAGNVLKVLNPDFAIEIVIRVLNAIPISVSGYFLVEEIVDYFDVKNVLKCLEVKVLDAVIDFQ